MKCSKMESNESHALRLSFLFHFILVALYKRILILIAATTSTNTSGDVDIRRSV